MLEGTGHLGGKLTQMKAKALGMGLMLWLCTRAAGGCMATKLHSWQVEIKWEELGTPTDYMPG